MDASAIFVFLGIFGAIPFILLYLYVKCNSAYQVHKRNGIKGPPPSFFFGHYNQRVKVGLIKFLEEAHSKYGPIVGHYLGKAPVISVKDLELIKLVTVKDFDYFRDRPQAPELVNMPKGLLDARGETWRRTRHILSPTFSSFKMRAMTPVFQQSVDTLVEVFQACSSEDKSFEISRIYSSFTMEALLAAAFGRKIEIQKGQSDQITDAAAVIFETANEKKLSSVIALVMLLSNFPWLKHVIKLFVGVSSLGKAMNTLIEVAFGLLEARRKESSTDQFKDLLQLMIDARSEDADDGKDGGRRRRLTDEDIVGNAVTFILGGHETSANSLACTSYLLALHPQVQQRLQQEIDDYYEENPNVSIYDAAQDLEYLDMVIRESLRMYPPIPVYSRLCVRDYHYKGITIPEGSYVSLPCCLLQMDPEYWTNPEIFDPLRFTAEEKAKRPQLCYMPFGHGPRSCIAMRFALLKAKMALIEVLKRFSFVQAADTEVPLETVLGITMVPKNGIYLKVVARV